MDYNGGGVGGSPLPNVGNVVTTKNADFRSVSNGQHVLWASIYGHYTGCVPTEIARSEGITVFVDKNFNIEFLSPVEGQVVYQGTKLHLQTSLLLDGAEVQKVIFIFPGQLRPQWVEIYRHQITDNICSYEWDTTNIAPGEYEITARLVLSSWEEKECSVKIKVERYASVRINKPYNNSWVSGQMEVSVEAWGPLSEINLYLQPKESCSKIPIFSWTPNGSRKYQTSIDSSNYTNGSYYLVAEAIASSGSKTHQVPIFVWNTNELVIEQPINGSAIRKNYRGFFVQARALKTVRPIARVGFFLRRSNEEYPLDPIISAEPILDGTNFVYQGFIGYVDPERYFIKAVGYDVDNSITCESPEIYVTVTSLFSITLSQSQVEPVMKGVQKKVSVTISGDQLVYANKLVSVSVSAKEGSGGHHNTNLSYVSKYPKHNHYQRITGVLSLPKSKERSKILVGRFDDYGIFNCIYYPGEVAGTEKIILRHGDVFGEVEEVGATIDVKVRGLELMPPADYYQLGGDRGDHTEVWYAFPDMIKQLQKVAKLYYENKQITLKFNDMALKWGGRCDIILADWGKAGGGSPHVTHRNGKCCDVNNIPAKGTSLANYLVTLFHDHGFYVFQEDANHWHVEYRPDEYPLKG